MLDIHTYILRLYHIWKWKYTHICIRMYVIYDVSRKFYIYIYVNKYIHMMHTYFLSHRPFNCSHRCQGVKFWMAPLRTFRFSIHDFHGSFDPAMAQWAQRVRFFNFQSCRSENWMSWTQNLERIPRKLDKSWCFHVSMCRKAKLDSKKNSFSVAFLLFLSPWIIISTPYQDIVRAIDPNSLFFLPPLCFQKTTKFELAWTSKNQKNMASWRTCQLPPKSYNKHHWNTIPFLSK